jgi:hypothetical protein
VSAEPAETAPPAVPVAPVFAPGPSRSGRHPAVAPLASLAAAAGAAAWVWRNDPHQPGHWLPLCPFHYVTGLLCPICGATRMVYDLMHGDLVRAFHDNALLFAAAPLIAVVWARCVVEGVRGRAWRPRLGRRANLAVVALLVVWGVARNVW